MEFLNIMNINRKLICLTYPLWKGKFKTRLFCAAKSDDVTETLIHFQLNDKSKLFPWILRECLIKYQSLIKNQYQWLVLTVILN